MSRFYLTAQELVELLGTTEAARVCAAFGGLSNVYVPRRPAADSRWARAVGLETARALATEYGGEYIEIPMGRDLKIKALQVQALLGKGLSAPEIARRAGVTERYVRIVAAAAPQADPRQPGLFDAA